MTPVQVWALLGEIARSHSHEDDTNVKSLEEARVAAFKDKLREFMRCRAFGTTIQIDTLRDIVKYCFPWYENSLLCDVEVPISESGVVTMTTNVGSDWTEYF